MNRSMTHRDRLLAALRGDEVDYVPCSVAFNALTPTQRRGRTWQFPWPEDATLDERTRYPVEQLGLDQAVSMRPNLCRPVDGVSSGTWVEGDILHKTYATGAGELHASVRLNEQWPYGRNIPLYDDFNVGHFIEPWLQNEADLACLMQVQELSDSAEALDAFRRSVLDIKAVADRYELATIAHVGEGLTGAMKLMGAEPVCLMTLDNPDLVDALLEYEHRINLRTIELLGELGVDIIRRNGFYETGDFYGPAMLQRFIGGRLRTEAAAIRAAGMHASYTVHTGVMEILDYLDSLTMDSLFGIDIAFKGFDLAACRDRLADHTTLWTGPSSTYHLWSGPDATRRAVHEVFDVLGGTGFVLGPAVSAHSIMPWESTEAMIDEWKRLR